MAVPDVSSNEAVGVPLLPAAVGCVIGDLADTSIRVWSLRTADGTAPNESYEVQLIASPPSRPNSLDSDCPACRRLRSELSSIARDAIERAAFATTNAIRFDIYTDPDRIVCLPKNALNPMVTISIHIHNGLGTTASKGVSKAVSRIKEALKQFGVRES